MDPSVLATQCSSSPYSSSCMSLSTTLVRLLNVHAANWQPCCAELTCVPVPAGTYYRSLQTSMIDLENLFDLFANSPQIQVSSLVSKITACGPADSMQHQPTLLSA